MTAKSLNLLPNKVTIYQRDRSARWQARIKLKSGEWYLGYRGLANHGLNGELNPKMILSNTHTKFWWNCDCGSVYKQSANYLVRLYLKKSSYLCENCKGN